MHRWGSFEKFIFQILPNDIGTAWYRFISHSLQLTVHTRTPPSQKKRIASWWLNQPSWTICSSSQKFGVKIQTYFFKPPPRLSSNHPFSRCNESCCFQGWRFKGMCLDCETTTSNWHGWAQKGPSNTRSSRKKTFGPCLGGYSTEKIKQRVAMSLCWVNNATCNESLFSIVWKYMCEWFNTKRSHNKQSPNQTKISSHRTSPSLCKSRSSLGRIPHWLLFSFTT